MIDLKATFEKFKEEYLKFKLVESPMSKRADMHAFMLLDKLMPGKSDMICAAEHDKFYLGTDCDDLAEIITEEQVCELVRCGVRFDGDGLCMFA